jgi:hypothetical protein
MLFLHVIFANVMMLQAQVNTSLPVGAIPGTIDVSPMGATTIQFLLKLCRARKKAPSGDGAWSTENIPPDILAAMDAATPPAAAATVPHVGKDFVLTGGPNTYFHPERAFTSAKQLFVTMGHELVHVSQYLALAGTGFTSIQMQQNKNFLDMLDFQAYNFSNKIGGNYWHSRLNNDWLNSDLGFFFNYLSTTNTSWQLNFKP